MQDFIAKAAGQFGISEDKVQGLVGGLLAKFRDDGDDADFNSLAEQVPGLGDMVSSADQAEPAAESGGGLLGGLMGGGGGMGGMLGKAASAVGAGGAMDVMGLVQKSGLDISQAGGLVQSLMGFLKDKVGDDLIANLLDKVPAIKKLLG